MKLNVLIVVLFLVFHEANSQQPNNTLLNTLNETIRASAKYDLDKIKKIDKLKESLSHSQQDPFEGFLKLYDEYSIFNYNSAYTYAKKMQEIADQQNDSSRIAYAKIKLSFILLSSGMFKEVFDAVSNMPLHNLNSAQKAEYYTLMARCYYDLADYDKDKVYSPVYNQQGHDYIDSSLLLFPDTSFSFIYYNGLKHVRSRNYEKALLYFEKLNHDPGLTHHQVALAASTACDIYIQSGQSDTAIQLLVKAAISDIQSSTKETSAAFNLATLLFKQGDLKNASTYIEKAVNDALFYGARQRKVQLSAILPLIEAEKLNIVEKEKETVVRYAVIVTLLLLILITLIIVVFRQFNKLKLAKQLITKAHHQQQLVNNKLMEANKIKEEYVGYFFSGNSEFYTRIEKFKRSIEQKILERKLEEIKFLVNNLNLKRERDELLKNFDQIFLKLFPNFIVEFNSMFKEEDQIKLKEGEILNTDLRIFALIRMGIHDNDKIAHILEYSVNTINTYKTRIKNKSVVANEEFEHRIMEIKSI